ncbi:Uncharacterised protein [Bacteroides xylanisolvens]|nr:Uncharacterised protein [Bacteroides xylanisolvens]
MHEYDKDPFSSPFSGTFFQSNRGSGILVSWDVFVPFLGDFFSISFSVMLTIFSICFRPLSRGLFFNDENNVFVPFLGDFFSIFFISETNG